MQNSNLTADVLTAKMPLSDSFNRSQAASAKQGSHHGLVLSYDAPNYPFGSFGTRYLKLTAGAGIIAATQIQQTTGLDPVVVSAILSSDWTGIDLEDSEFGAGPGIVSTNPNVYLVYLKVNYTQPTVDTLTGLVSNLGTQTVELKIKLESSGGIYNTEGLVIGKFCRADFMVQPIGDHVCSESDIVQDNVEGSLPNALKTSTYLGLAIRAGVERQAHNPRKHLHIEGVSNVDAISSLNTITMPLTGVATDYAFSNADLNGWLMPVNWLDTIQNIVSTAGIYMNVEKFELFNSRFGINAQFGFWRHHGNGNFYKTQADASNFTLCQDPTTVRGWKDYGSDTFVFDGKGSVFEKNLTLDLVLDFLGENHTRVFNIVLKNLEVEGDLTINIGQSFPWLAGGSMGIITEENVKVGGANHIIRTWPGVRDIAEDSTDISNVWTASYPQANRSWYYINSAKGMVFTGYSTSGPTALRDWGRLSGGTNKTKGPLVTAYLHKRLASGGSGVTMAMQNPWLEQGVDGAVIIKNSTLPSALFPYYYNSGTSSDWDTRLRLQNCHYKEQGSISTYGYRVAPLFKISGDMVGTLNLTFGKELQVQGNIVTEGDLDVVGQVNLASGSHQIGLNGVVLSGWKRRFSPTGMSGFGILTSSHLSALLTCTPTINFQSYKIAQLDLPELSGERLFIKASLTILIPGITTGWHLLASLPILIPGITTGWHLLASLPAKVTSQASGFSDYVTFSPYTENNHLFGAISFVGTPYITSGSEVPNAPVLYLAGNGSTCGLFFRSSDSMQSYVHKLHIELDGCYAAS